MAGRPDLFLFLGDTVYCETENMDELRAAYTRLATVPGFKALKRQCPILATWDDNDYGKADGGADYVHKAESQAIFLDFFAEPEDSPRRKRPGVYIAKTIGPEGQRAQILVLDTRYFRSPLKKSATKDPNGPRYVPDADPEKTMLGEAQWAWLEEELRRPAELRLVVSSVQLIAQEQGFEKWGNLPLERERFFTLIAKTRAEGIVILSGDRHFAELSRTEEGGYPIYELTSSGLNNATRGDRYKEPNRFRVPPSVAGNNFGLVDIDWQTRTVSLRIANQEGRVKLSHRVALDDLRFR